MESLQMAEIIETIILTGIDSIHAMPELSICKA